MIDLARRVAEGALAGNDDQRAKALRLLGIGLYLDGRPDGAERAFTELLALHPKTTLDRATTRADAVAFFNDVRYRRQPRPHFALVFLPPAGQFQNDTPKRGWLIGGLELATLGTAVTTRLLLGNWRRDADGTCTVSQSTCDNLKLANGISVAAFATTWLVGVIDAWLNHADNAAPPSDQAPRAASARPRARAAAPRPTLVLLPSGAALHLRF